MKQLRAIGGVMITASHNPPTFNGYKLKAHFGGSADSADCAAVEKLLSTSPVLRLAVADALRNKRLHLGNQRPAHFRAIKRLVDFPLIARARLRVAHDASFGVGAGRFETMLAGTTCRVTTLNGTPDPLFGGINPEPLAKNYVLGAAQLRRDPHDLCLVTDGDFDRIGAMEGNGRPLTNQQVIALLLHHLVRNRYGGQDVLGIRGEAAGRELEVAAAEAERIGSKPFSIYSELPGTDPYAGWCGSPDGRNPVRAISPLVAHFLSLSSLTFVSRFMATTTPFVTQSAATRS